MTALAIILRYWREIAMGLLALLILSGCLYIKHVFADRDRLKQDNAVLQTALSSAKTQQELVNQITDAVSKIKVRSQVNVSRIETAPKPAFHGAPLVLVPGGMLHAVYSSGRAANGTAPGPAGN